MPKEKEIIQIFAEIDNIEEMDRFFKEIFTPSERRNIQLRWKLMKRIKRGDSQRKIAADLGISLCKITRGSKIIHNPKSETNKLLNKYMKS